MSEENKIDYEITYFSEIENYTVTFNTSGDSCFSRNRVNVADENYTIVNDYLPVPKYLKKKAFRLDKPMMNFKGTSLLTDYLSQNIYEVSKEACILKYYFDFGDANLNTSYLELSHKLPLAKLFIQVNKSGYVNSIDYFTETEAFLYIVFIYDGDMCVAFYDKTNQQSYVISESSIDSYNKFWVMSPNLCSTSDGKLVSVLNGTDAEEPELLKFKEQNISLIESIKDVLTQHNEFMNPVLMLTHIKRP